MYLTYEEYQDMGGTIDETSYTKFEYKAESIIDWYTFNRLADETEYPEKVKICMYMLIDILVSQDSTLHTMGDNGDDGTVLSIASQSNDGVSVSYNVLSASEAYQYEGGEIGNTVKRMLQGVTNSLGRKLLYRGLYPDE